MTWSALGGIIATMVAICTLLDWVLSREEIARQKLSLVRWWLHLDSFSVRESIPQAVAFFNRCFDVVYGPAALSWRRARMSLLTTLAILGAAIAVSLANGYHPIFYDFGIMLLPFFLFVNVIVDYVSLNKTRWLLAHSEGAGLYRLLMFLLLDTAFTIILYFVGLLVFFIPGWQDDLGEHLDFFVKTVKGESEYMAPIFFIAAFGTSLLFYALLLSTITCKVLGLFRSRLMIFLERLEASDNLFKSVGVVAGALLAAGKGLGEILGNFRT